MRIAELGVDDLNKEIETKLKDIRELSASLGERSEMLSWMKKWTDVVNIGIWVELEEKCAQLGKPLEKHFYTLIPGVDRSKWR